MKCKAGILFIAIVSIIVLSCHKGDEDNNNPGNNTLVLASVEYEFIGNTERQTFNYNNAGFISKVVSEIWPADKDSTYKKPYYTVDIEWSSNNTLTKVVHTTPTPTPYTLQFIKGAGHQMVRKGLYPMTNAFGSETWLGFDNKGRIVADSNYAGGNPPISNYRLFTWDSNDNLIRIDNYVVNSSGGYTNSYWIECTYDDKKNPLHSFAPYFFALNMGGYYSYQSKNNLIQEKIVFGGIPSVQAAYRYEYNQQGYPTKRISTSSNSTPANNVKYTYK
jgi:hypothetical protein